MKFGETIYTPEVSAGLAVSKKENHIPKIEAPDSVRAGEPFEVKIKIVNHPNTVQHSFRWIELYFYEDGRDFNPIFVARAELVPEISEQEATFKMKIQKSGKIYVLAYCNLHGVWENRKNIVIK
ncbi:MAG: class II SORL domain-containing protein [Archaeoglobaceae archaeon]|nr:class II SORL domain-containing protein [Archaeoglobaceae archaeon]MCX8151974.1 class II SORL domain-containing protein [Archaeoglobaceae archaeon]MDW8013363.1 class II SORL domain-containing protein [Archaeoglobaceae archaeon]